MRVAVLSTLVSRQLLALTCARLELLIRVLRHTLSQRMPWQRLSRKLKQLRSQAPSPKILPRLPLIRSTWVSLVIPVLVLSWVLARSVTKIWLLEQLSLWTTLQWQIVSAINMGFKMDSPFAALGTIPSKAAHTRGSILTRQLGALACRHQIRYSLWLPRRSHLKWFWASTHLWPRARLSPSKSAFHAVMQVWHFQPQINWLTVLMEFQMWLRFKVGVPVEPVLSKLTHI